MKAIVKGIHLIIYDYSSLERAKVKKLLTFKDKDGNVSKKLYRIYNNKIFTFWGFNSLFEDLEINNEDDKLVSQFSVKKEDIEDCFNDFKLLDFQKFAVYKAINRKFGCLSIPTGGGKTEIMIFIAKTLFKLKLTDKICVVVPSNFLATQFKERCILRGFNKSSVGIYSGTEKNLDVDICVFVINSLYQKLKEKDKDVVDFISRCNTVFWDESHHLQASSYFFVLKCLSADYILGFSGSLYSTDFDSIHENYNDCFKLGVYGKPIFHISSKTLRGFGLISTPHIYYDYIGSKKPSFFMSSYTNLEKKFIIENKLRNEKIVQHCNSFLRRNLQVIINVRSLNHGLTLLKMLNNPKAVCIYGGNVCYDFNCGEYDKSKLDFEIFKNDFSKRNYEVVIMSQVGDEGVDLPSAGALIFAAAGKSRIKALQRIGRVCRKKDNNYNVSFVVDFKDSTHVYFKSQYKKRRDIFEKEGAVIYDDYSLFIKAMDYMLS